jgi:hypothetical protein
LARPVALPYVRSKALYFVVKGVVDGDFVAAMVIDRIGQQLEADAVSGSVIASRMCPRGCDEEVGVNRFV